MTDHDDKLQAAAARVLGQDLTDVIASGEDAKVVLPEPGAQSMVKTSLKIPLDMYERVQEVAEARQIGVSTLIREWIAAGLTAEAEDQQISLAQLRGAIANLVQAGHAA
jgi:predicted DNA-binding protein